MTVTSKRRGVLVIGLGNELRHDDGAGVEIARLLREPAERAGIEVREMQGEPLSLLDGWRHCGSLIVVDTMRSGAAPGTIRRIDVTDEPLPAMLDASSTHAVGIGEAIELARTLDRLPPRVIVYAVEGRRFDAGLGLSEALTAVVPKLATIVLDEARALASVAHADVSF